MGKNLLYTKFLNMKKLETAITPYVSGLRFVLKNSNIDFRIFCSLLSY